MKFDWTEKYGLAGKYLHKSLPPLLIVTINTLVLIILDYASVAETYDSHSKYQIAVYLKTVIYTTLNIFIIPVLTLASSGKTLFEIISDNNWNFGKLLSELFIPASGEFFVILLLQ